jgi:hypothetical protein
MKVIGFENLVEAVLKGQILKKKVSNTLTLKFCEEDT